MAKFLGHHIIIICPINNLFCLKWLSFFLQRNEKTLFHPATHGYYSHGCGRSEQFHLLLTFINLLQGLDIMQSQLRVRIFVGVLAIAVLLCSGCAGYLKPEVGAVAREEARFPLANEGTKEHSLATNDLIIIFTQSGGEKNLTISGYVVFDRSVTDSFSVIAKFWLKLNFLDGAGRVLETTDISPIFHTFGGVPEKLDFKAVRVVPPGSKAIAFNYFGVFQDSPPESSGSWEIYYFPFD